MSHIDNANKICDDIELGIRHGLVAPNPTTAWVAYENYDNAILIVVFNPRMNFIMSRDDYDEMEVVFNDRFGVRISYVEVRGVYFCETLRFEGNPIEKGWRILEHDISGKKIVR